MEVAKALRRWSSSRNSWHACGSGQWQGIVRRIGEIRRPWRCLGSSKPAFLNSIFPGARCGCGRSMVLHAEAVFAVGRQCSPLGGPVRIADLRFLVEVRAQLDSIMARRPAAKMIVHNSSEAQGTLMNAAGDLRRIDRRRHVIAVGSKSSPIASRMTSLSGDFAGTALGTLRDRSRRYSAGRSVVREALGLAS